MSWYNWIFIAAMAGSVVMAGFLWWHARQERSAESVKAADERAAVDALAQIAVADAEATKIADRKRAELELEMARAMASDPPLPPGKRLTQADALAVLERARKAGKS